MNDAKNNEIMAVSSNFIDRRMQNAARISMTSSLAACIALVAIAINLISSVPSADNLHEIGTLTKINYEASKACLNLTKYFSISSAIFISNEIFELLGFIYCVIFLGKNFKLLKENHKKIVFLFTSGVAITLSQALKSVGILIFLLSVALSLSTIWNYADAVSSIKLGAS